MRSCDERSSNSDLSFTQRRKEDAKAQRRILIRLCAFASSLRLCVKPYSDTLIDLILKDLGFGKVVEFGEVSGVAIEGVAWD